MQLLEKDLDAVLLEVSSRGKVWFPLSRYSFLPIKRSSITPETEHMREWSSEIPGHRPSRPAQ